MADDNEPVSIPRRKYPHAPQPAAPEINPQAEQAESPAGIPLGQMSEADSRARAAKRAAVLRDHLGEGDGTDDFFIEPRVIPPGWTYEWKRHTTLGAQDPAYEVQIARAGWEAVPVSRHPEMMPMGYTGGTILRKGQILMERPTETVDQARAIELRKARGQVRQKEQQLYGAPAGDNSPFDPTNKGNSLVSIKRSYEPMPIPKE